MSLALPSCSAMLMRRVAIDENILGEIEESYSLACLAKMSMRSEAPFPQAPWASKTKGTEVREEAVAKSL